MKKDFLICFDADGAGGGGEPAPILEQAPTGEPAPTPAPAADPAPNADPAPAPKEPPVKHKSAFDMGGDDGDGAGNEPKGGDGAEPKPAEGVPEKYEFNLAEGLVMDEETGAKLTAVGKKYNLTQEAMDDILRLHGDVMYDIQQQAEKQYDDWLTECKKQNLLGKEQIQNALEPFRLFGDNFDNSGVSEVQRVLTETGVANHPAVQRFLQSMGRLLREDNPPAAKPAQVQDVGKLLFSNSKYE